MGHPPRLLFLHQSSPGSIHPVHPVPPSHRRRRIHRSTSTWSTIGGTTSLHLFAGEGGGHFGAPATYVGSFVRSDNVPWTAGQRRKIINIMFGWEIGLFDHRTRLALKKLTGVQWSFGMWDKTMVLINHGVCSAGCGWFTDVISRLVSFRGYVSFLFMEVDAHPFNN